MAAKLTLGLTFAFVFKELSIGFWGFFHCRSITRLRKAQSAHGSEGSMHSDGTLPERSAALRANYAKQFALHKPSPSRQKSVKMAAARPRAMILCATAVFAPSVLCCLLGGKD